MSLQRELPKICFREEIIMIDLLSAVTEQQKNRRQGS